VRSLPAVRALPLQSRFPRTLVLRTAWGTIQRHELTQTGMLARIESYTQLQRSCDPVSLLKQYRVIVFEVPGFGQSPTNERSQSMPELALTMAQASTNLGLERFNLMGNSFGGKLALWMAIQQPERIQALILVAPAAIRPAGGCRHRRSHQRNGWPGCTRIGNVRHSRRPRTWRLSPSNRPWSAALGP
jgi:pimeloyl-ACP methyl ester carboxylesterase